MLPWHLWGPAPGLGHYVSCFSCCQIPNKKQLKGKRIYLSLLSEGAVRWGGEQHGGRSMRQLETLYLQSGNTADQKYGLGYKNPRPSPTVSHFLQQTPYLLTGLCNLQKQCHHLETRGTNTCAYGGHSTLKPPWHSSHMPVGPSVLSVGFFFN